VPVFVNWPGAQQVCVDQQKCGSGQLPLASGGLPLIVHTQLPLASGDWK
jgi:hypothetical protein